MYVCPVDCSTFRTISDEIFWSVYGRGPRNRQLDFGGEVLCQAPSLPVLRLFSHGGIMFSGCSCVCLSVYAPFRASRTSLTQYLEKYWTYFHQLSVLLHFRTRISASSSGVRRSKFKVTVDPTCWNMHFLALLTLYFENCWTEFHQSFSVNAFWDKDASMFGVIMSKVNVTACPKAQRRVLIV